MLQRIGQDIERALQGIEGTRSVYAERVTQGYFTDIQIDRAAIARYRLAIADVQDVIQSALGGENVTWTIEGRERYPVNVRYTREFRQSIPDLERVFIKTPAGAQVPLGQLAEITAVGQLLADDAVAAARRADQAIARAERPGLLHGVPMTIKNSIDRDVSNRLRTSSIPA